MKSLKWYRGWKITDSVNHEFNEIEKHEKLSHSCGECLVAEEKCVHRQQSFWERLRMIKEPSTIKPLIIITMVMFIAFFDGSATRPFVQQIMKAYGSPLDNNVYLVSPFFFRKISPFFSIKGFWE